MNLTQLGYQPSRAVFQKNLNTSLDEPYACRVSHAALSMFHVGIASCALQVGHSVFVKSGIASDFCPKNEVPAQQGNAESLQRRARSSNLRNPGLYRHCLSPDGALAPFIPEVGTRLHSGFSLAPNLCFGQVALSTTRSVTAWGMCL